MSPSTTSTNSTLPLRPYFIPNPTGQETPTIKALIHALSLRPHPEGGYFIETDRAPEFVPSPFPTSQGSSAITRTKNTSETKTPETGTLRETISTQRPGFSPLFRNTSTTIFYLLTPKNPQGSFHRNRGRTVHTLHWGRGQYVLVHADEDDEAVGGEVNGEVDDAKSGVKMKRIETFVVGADVERGEKLQWIVPGGKYKASFLLPDAGDGDWGSERGLLISETVVPGFEFWDHDFLGRKGLEGLVGGEAAGSLGWLVRGG